MPLSELIDQKFDAVPLVPHSGVQFIDLAFGIPKGQDFPDSWGFLEMPARGRSEPASRWVRRGDEVFAHSVGVTESYSIGVSDILKNFERVWVPLPLLRRQSSGFFRGPINWARAYLAPMREADLEGRTHRLVLAVDTTLLPYADDEAYLAPSPEDARVNSSAQFALPHHKDAVDWYYEQEWVRAWAEAVMRAHLDNEQRRRRRHAFRAMTDEEFREQLEDRPHEPINRYRAYIDLLAALGVVPALKFIDRFTEPRAPAVDVDLVLDLGNSRSCGVLIESDPNEDKVDLQRAVKLQMRDLTLAEQVYSDPFPSRFEFARARFGWDHLSIRSGRMAAFAWPTVTRVGVEAARLAAQRSGSEGSSGLSTPKRYLWDTDAQLDQWRVNSATRSTQDSPFATDVAFTALVNELGEALHRIPPAELERNPDRGILAIRALYTRSNLTAFALAEIFVQALSMMNSPMHRLRRSGTAERPRRLRSIIMTLPTAMSLKERNILKEQASAALDLAFISMNLAELQYDADSGGSKLHYSTEWRLNPGDPCSGPEIVLKWDEATATQAVYLYTEIAQKHSGGAHRFFDIMRRPDNSQDPQTREGLRIGTLDVGGGTTDLVITNLTAEGVRNSNNVTLKIDPLMREGFNLAGDDALLQVVQDHLVAPLRSALSEAGLGDRVEGLLNQLMGADHGTRQASEYARRQRFTSLIAAPIGLKMLHAYEKFDAAQVNAATSLRLVEMLGPIDEATNELIDQVNTVIRASGLQGFDIRQVQIPLHLPEIDRSVRSVFRKSLTAIGELVRHFRCDVLILSGRTSRLPAVRALLEETAALPSHRVISLHNYRVGPWYPFRDDRGCVGDPKTTATVGAVICRLSAGQLLHFNLRSERLATRSTARYFGKITDDGLLPREDVFYDNLDLDDPEYQLPDEREFAFHGPMKLGFKQLAPDWWPATKQYELNYAATNDRIKYSVRTPLHVSLKLTGGPAEADRPNREKRPTYIEFDIKEIKDRDGARIPSKALRLRFRTLDQELGYWLDTGILLGN